MRFYTNVSQIGNYIYHRYIDHDGRKKEEYSNFVDIDLYIPSHEETPYKAFFNGQSLKRVSFAKIADAKDFINEFDDVENMPIHGNRNWWAQFIAKEYPEEHIKYDPEKLIIANIDIEVSMTFDNGDKGFPEPEQAPAKVTAITVEVNNEYFVFGSKEYTKELDDNVKHTPAKDEADLLLNFLRFWEELKPDVVTGWNIDGFDIPYLVNRISKILGDEQVTRLSPAKRFLKGKAVNVWEKNRDGRTYKEYIIHGLAVNDLLKLYKSYTFKMRERYSLDYIAYVELGRNKLDYSEYGNLDDVYREDYNTYIDYNIRDVKLVRELNDKLKLIELAMSLTYQAKIRHEDHFYQVRMWDTLIYNKLLEKNVVVPPMKASEKNEKYAGAVVFDPQVGMHDWVVSADLNSLYPSLMRQYNISPEKLVTRMDLSVQSSGAAKDLVEYFHPDRDKLLVKVEDFLDGEQKEIHRLVKELNLSMTANGVLYRKDSQGFLPQLMEEIYEKRKEMKNHMIDAQKKFEETQDPKYKNDIAMYKTMQMSYKTLLNSCYGAIGNQYFRLYNVDMAESITISGQLSIQWIQRRINTYLNKLFKTGDYDYIVAGDTDSFYMSLAKFVELVVGDKKVSKQKIVDLIDDFFEEKIQPKIDQAYSELAEYMNAYEQQMIMKREVIADRGIWRAKKNYALNVYDSEGVRFNEPQLKIMGIEAIKSSTPELCRNALKESIRIILQETELDLQKYVRDFKKKFYEADVDVISFPSGISDLDKWRYDDIVGFKKGTPFHVKGAISYNRLLNKKKLSGKYREIGSGDKIKYIYLSLPNPIHANVIAWADILPPEFELDKYINHKLQYEKSYLHPLESITDKVGWTTEKRNTLF